MDIFEFRRRGQSWVDERTEDLAYAVIGAAIEVHREHGPGMPEEVYRNSLCYELELRGIPYQYEVTVPIFYKGKPVGSGRLDLLIGNVLIVEPKVVQDLADVHSAQAVGYLKATKLELALLINFNVVVLKHGIKRVINTPRPA